MCGHSRHRSSQHSANRQGRGLRPLSCPHGVLVGPTFVTTVVTFEENMRGWLASIRRAKDVAREVPAYDQLIRLVRFFQSWEILRFDEQAAVRLKEFRKQGIRRIGPLDLKIASITIGHDAILLSANLVDFEQVPGLHMEDWLH